MLFFNLRRRVIHLNQGKLDFNEKFTIKYYLTPSDHFGVYKQKENRTLMPLNVKIPRVLDANVGIIRTILTCPPKTGPLLKLEI